MAVAMADNEIKEIAKRLQALRKKAGLSTAEAAEATGQSDDTVKSHEKGVRGISRDKALKYARLYGVDVEYVLGFQKAPQGVQLSATRGLPVKGSVMAGAFRESLEDPDGDQERLPVQYDTAYAEAVQFALRVQGASMNQIYPDGSYVICVRVEDSQPRVGDHVVVQREKGGLYEFTLKELQRNPKTGRLYLLPKSDDPKFQAPIELVDGQIEIVAVVIGSYQRRSRRGPSAF